MQTNIEQARLCGAGFQADLRTGLTGGQVDVLRDGFGICLMRSGRLCMSGLNSDNVDRVARGLAAVLG